MSRVTATEVAPAGFFNLFNIICVSVLVGLVVLKLKLRH